MDHLKTIWNKLTSKFTDDDELIDKLWMEIQNEYNAEERHYHNLAHLDYMMRFVTRYKNKISDLDTLMFSIFYHDIVYDVSSQDNEQKSAVVAVDRMTKLGVPKDKIEKCQNQINATKEHQEIDDKDTNLLVDFDLAILGDTPDNYKEYTEKIRREYSIYPDETYKKGRKAVLQHFLDMDRIFKTNEFYENYEKQACENLKVEIGKL